MRALALSLKVPYTSLQRRLKWGQIRKHTSTIKPYLKLANQIDRLKFTVSMVDERTVLDAMPKFIDMRKIVHTDEKWFDLTKKRGPTTYRQKKLILSAVSKAKTE